MAKITAMPFRSVDGDRPVSATMDARRFGQYVTNGIDGVSNEDAFLVEVVENEFAITVKPGGAVINGYSGWLDETATLTPNTPDLTYPRIDRVVFRLNLNLDVRFFEIVLLEGTPAQTPTPPEYVRDEFIHDLVIADVLIPAGSLTLDASAVTDHRKNPDLCGESGAKLSKTNTKITENMLDPVITESIKRAETSANAAKKYVGDILVTKRNLSKDNTFITASGNTYLKGTYPELDTLLGTPRKTVDFSITTNAYQYISFLTYINGKYYICGNTGVIHVSSDGLEWNTIAMPTLMSSLATHRIVYNGAVYIVFPKTGNYYAISWDGVTWKTVGMTGITGDYSSNLRTGIEFSWVQTYEGKFYVKNSPLATTNEIYVSEDGLTWTTITTQAYSWYIVSGNGIVCSFKTDTQSFINLEAEIYSSVRIHNGNALFTDMEEVNPSLSLDTDVREGKIIFDEKAGVFVALYNNSKSVKMATSTDMRTWTIKKTIGSTDTYVPVVGLLAIDDGYVIYWESVQDTTYNLQLVPRNFGTITTLTQGTALEVGSFTLNPLCWTTNGEDILVAGKRDDGGEKGGYAIKKYMTVPKLTHSNYNTYVKARSDE